MVMVFLRVFLVRLMGWLVVFCFCFFGAASLLAIRRSTSHVLNSTKHQTSKRIN